MKEEYAKKVSIALEEANEENYNQYNVYYKCNKPFPKKLEIENLCQNYINKVLSVKLNKTKEFELSSILSKRIIEHITGNYDIGVNRDYEEIDNDLSLISTMVANTDLEDVEKGIDTIIDGSVACKLIYENQADKGKYLYNQKSEELKKIFKKTLFNITHLNETLANSIAKIAKMDNANELNQNIGGKLIGGIAYELISGTLISKRHFTNVTNSPTMMDLINKEGIVHFTSEETANKIMNSGYIKPSDILKSDMTYKKCFFFAGTPSFEDLVINIPAYHVMTAIKIKPTDEQIKDLKYRAINDGAVSYDGKFSIDKSNTYIAYYGLKYNSETNTLYYSEISKEEAKNYKVSDEVLKNYNYNPKSLVDNIKLNAYGFYAEYKHHQKLQQMLKVCNLYDMDDKTLNEVRNIEEAKGKIK